jgi:SAM-dependent methyltransferase
MAEGPHTFEFMDSTPHASWAEVYDTAYQKTFGHAYQALTDTTLAELQRMCAAPASVVDFGAATGRLAIPLAKAGYEVTAVEPCAEMLDQLRHKDPDGRVTTVNAKMEDFQGDQQFDAALCVFTVLLYLLDESALHSSLRAAVGCLKAEGLLLLDIPSIAAFRSMPGRSQSGFHRSWKVNPLPDEPDVYEYIEDTRITDVNGAQKNYADSFRIRYWPEEVVLQSGQDNGLIKLEGPLPQFAGTGSSYFWFRKG